jgi:hypothetical protein
MEKHVTVSWPSYLCRHRLLVRANLARLLHLPLPGAHEHRPG